VLAAQRRDTRDERTGALVRQDLASTRLRGEWRPAGVSASLQVERTGEAENRRLRVLTFVGAGRGSYDATGNFVGTGDHDLVLVVSPELERFARTATSARGAWVFGTSESWRGSRVELTLEDEARRRGEGRWADVVLSVVARSAMRHSRARACCSASSPNWRRGRGRRVPLARRATRRRRSHVRELHAGDRSTHGGAPLARAARGHHECRGRGRISWQRASQSVTGGARYARTLVEQGGTAQFVRQPDAALRAAAVVEATWSRAPGERTRTHLARGTGPVRHGGTRGARRPHRATCVRERRAARAAPERGPDRRGALGCDRTFRLAPA
jgi:hypothetical protein